MYSSEKQNNQQVMVKGYQSSLIRGMHTIVQKQKI